MVVLFKYKRALIYLLFFRVFRLVQGGDSEQLLKVVVAGRIGMMVEGGGSLTCEACRGFP